jgi:phage gp36-like protein
MSKSVTVIRGKVWTRRSVTWNRNVASGNVNVHVEEANAAAGDSPDDAPMCRADSVHKGRNFTRRVKTS